MTKDDLQSAIRVTGHDSPEMFAVSFAVLGMFILLVMLNLHGQRRLQLDRFEKKQRFWFNQIYESYLIRSKTLEIRIKQLAQHREVLKKGKEEAEKMNLRMRK